MPTTRESIPVDSHQAPLREPDDCSLVGGGLLHEFRKRVQLRGDARAWAHRRVLVAVVLAWVPLLLLSIVDGRAWGGGTALAFLQDVEAQVRLLIAAPLLILAEPVVYRRLRSITRCFVANGLVPDAARPRFDDAVASAMRLHNSVVAELLLIALVYAVGMLVVRRTVFVLDVDSWYASVQGGRHQLTHAGWWGALVSMPIVQFLVVRWYFRFFAWARFLWQVSRIQLNLRPTHPDRTAGLYFVALTERAYRPVLLGLGAVLAGMIANRIFYAGATLLEFKVEIIGTVALLLAMILGPMLVFAQQLMTARNRGIADYGRLGQHYAAGFERKWMSVDHPADEPLLGSADIQSLGDLRNGFVVVKNMRVVPFDLLNVVVLAAVILTPVLPLLLTIASVEEILDRLLQTIF